ncbi:MAG TPA: helix-turn-helix domain-containing protein, partial [Microlunatus sp.]|nr:helix-turn-helix domain-containing protein [Microlunatus sp.]
MGQDRSTDAEPFMALLRTFRERAGLTQEELAERAGLTPHAISALERGARTRPYPHTVRALAGALGLSAVEAEHFVSAVPRRPTSSSTRGKDSKIVSSPQDGPGRDPVFVVPPTRLYGRDRDIADAAKLVRSGTRRLITLTGPGGVGKTRLAAALADTLVGDFSDGVVVVPLAAVAEAQDVLGTIGRAMEIPGSDQGDVLAVITRHLGRARVLLVLDNFEHLMTAAPTTSQLVASCPALTILVTSRSPLRVRGEHEVPVGPLELPPRDVTSPELLAEWPAGAFVLDRAHDLSAQLILDQNQTRALADLCHRLAGLPLAIELATAHLRLLTPQTLLDRLEQLTPAGARDLPSRQQTMRATLDWSHRLLTLEQQRLFRMLAVLRGGATLTVIEEVAVGSMFPAEEVLALLEVLVEQSLVVVQGGGAGERRFDLLEPVAQYARGLLLGDDAHRTAAAHADTFLHLAEDAALGYQGADQVLWLQ